MGSTKATRDNSSRRNKEAIVVVWASGEEDFNKRFDIIVDC